MCVINVRIYLRMCVYVQIGVCKYMDIVYIAIDKDLITELPNSLALLKKFKRIFRFIKEIEHLAQIFCIYLMVLQMHNVFQCHSPTPERYVCYSCRTCVDTPSSLC